MEKELKKIKKLYGERMSRFCRDSFPSILEEEGRLLELLTAHFEPEHHLYNDIIEHRLEGKFKKNIYKLMQGEEKKETSDKSPKELLSEAGYDLFECKTEEEIQSFKKYYARGEELCTFNGGRLNKCRVFFAIKKNVDEIKRENFKTPERQDEYGTSVISIQFTKDDTNTLSIKNRYNHKVKNPDATFGNNLDSIIIGLTKSFENYYGIVQRYNNYGFEIPGYVRANDGKFYKYNYEMHNVYYCTNNIIIDNFEVKKYEKEKYVILDYFILDLMKKRIKLYDKKCVTDAFVHTIKKVDKISINKVNDKKEIVITNKKGNKIIIKLNSLNKIVYYENYSLKRVRDKFLYNSDAINAVIVPNATKIGSDFCTKTKVLEELNLDSAKIIDDHFCENNTKLSELSLKNAKKIGHFCLSSASGLMKFDAPKVRKIGWAFLNWDQDLEELNMPNLQKTDAHFCERTKKLRKVNLERLKTINSYSLQKCHFSCDSIPNLKYIKVYDTEYMAHWNTYEFQGKKLKVKTIKGL